MYENAKSAGSPRTLESVGSELERLLHRLGEVANQIESTGNRVVGSEPRPAEVHTPQIPMESLARGVRLAHEIVSRIDNELQRIDARL